MLMSSSMIKFHAFEQILGQSSEKPHDQMINQFYSPPEQYESFDENDFLTSTASWLHLGMIFHL
jgi:hypothetical protein